MEEVETEEMKKRKGNSNDKKGKAFGAKKAKRTPVSKKPTVKKR